MDNKNSGQKNPKILKLKFGKKETEPLKEPAAFSKSIEEEKKEDNTSKTIKTINISPPQNFKGVPQILNNTSKKTITPNKFTPFKKKTFIPKLNENKFAIKKTDPKKPGEFRPKFERKSFGPKPAFSPAPTFKPSFAPTLGFDKKTLPNNNDSAKKKKFIKKESTKPKTMKFSSLVGNNFRGRIEYSTLEDSEYYKVRKQKRQSSNKQKQFLEKTITLETEMSLKELASKLSTKFDEIARQARYIGYEGSMSDETLINIEVLEMIATSLGHKVIRKDALNQEKFEVFNIKIDEKTSVKRPPIVAIVGHVDHGKTSLLDKIRKSHLTKSEIGGITQKIAAYSIALKEGSITFIDTPGHAAFSNMRSRGINLNDISILVISAVEGVKDQTIEAINQIKKFKTPFIIAATKCDLPNSNIEKIKQDLSKHDVLVKDYGGDIEMIEVSALTGHNIELLLQTIIVYSDLLELKANPKEKAIGVVLESKIDIKSGVFATLLIQQGTLKVGQICSTLKTFGKIKGMWNDLQKPIKEASPGMAVEVLGFSECPNPGDKFAVVEHELATELTKQVVDQYIKPKTVSIEDLFQEPKPTLHLILNADTQGALEALENIINTLDTTHSSYKIIKKSVGKIKDSDFDLAKISDSQIINYNLAIAKDIELKAKNENIKILSSKIIYEIENFVKDELEKIVTLIAEEVYMGTAIVKRLFKSSKIGNISGCMVTDGKIQKGLVVKVIRNKKEVFTGKVESLKRSKDDVKEVINGLECGIFVNYKEIAEDDEIMCYKIEYKKPS